MAKTKRKPGRPPRHPGQVVIGANIRAAREKSGFSVDEVAKKTAIPRTRLYAMERGDAAIGPLELRRLSLTLSIELVDLYKGVK